MRVTAWDAAGNSSVYSDPGGLKDLGVPILPTAASVNLGPSNPVNIINVYNEIAVQVGVTFGGGFDVTDAVVVELDDGTTQVQSLHHAATAS